MIPEINEDKCKILRKIRDLKFTIVQKYIQLYPQKFFKDILKHVPDYKNPQIFEIFLKKIYCLSSSDMLTYILKKSLLYPQTSFK